MCSKWTWIMQNSEEHMLKICILQIGVKLFILVTLNFLILLNIIISWHILGARLPVKMCIVVSSSFCQTVLNVLVFMHENCLNLHLKVATPLSHWPSFLFKLLSVGRNLRIVLIDHIIEASCGTGHFMCLATNTCWLMFCTDLPQVTQDLTYANLT
jgi:hypothetical protein